MHLIWLTPVAVCQAGTYSGPGAAACTREWQSFTNSSNCLCVLDRVSGRLLLRRGQHQCQLHRHGGRAGEGWHLFQFCSVSIRILLSAWNHALQHHRYIGSELLHCHSAHASLCAFSVLGHVLDVLIRHRRLRGLRARLLLHGRQQVVHGCVQPRAQHPWPSGGLIDAGRQLATPTPTSRPTPAPPPRALVLACGTALHCWLIGGSVLDV